MVKSKEHFINLLATLAQLIEHSIRNRKVSSLSLEGGSIF